jgi:hypothetical protein
VSGGAGFRSGLEEGEGFEDTHHGNPPPCPMPHATKAVSNMWNSG